MHANQLFFLSLQTRSCSEIKAEISPTKAEQSAQTSSSPSARDQTNPKGSVKEELDDKHGILFTVIQLSLNKRPRITVRKGSAYWKDGV